MSAHGRARRVRVRVRACACACARGRKRPLECGENEAAGTWNHPPMRLDAWSFLV